MGIQAKVGDVFLVPLDDRSWACGQIVSAWNDELYLAIFGQKVEDRSVDVRSAIDQEPALLVLTLDAKFWHGDWPIIGNVRENLADFPQPAFKVRQSGVVYVESRDRAISRPASPSEVEILRYRNVSSPAVIEEAIHAYFGIGEWNPHFDKFHADYAYRSGQLL
jgi:hypothetical protein